jgi:hypothetical protein
VVSVGCEHQRRGPGVRRGVDVDAGGEQPRDLGAVTLGRRAAQRVAGVGQSQSRVSGEER